MYCVRLKQFDHIPSSLHIHKPDDLGSDNGVEPMSHPCEKLPGVVKIYTNIIQIIYLLSTKLQVHVCMR